MTRRILGLGIAAAAALSFGLPAAPAQAHHCINWFTTPRQCAEDVEDRIRAICPIEGTQVTCLENIST